MSSWAHQTLSSGGKGDNKTCQAEEREGACFPGPGGLGSWERSQTDEHWEEECLPSLSSGGLSCKEQCRPQAIAGEAAFRPGGLRKAFPTGLQAQRSVSMGASSSPNTLGVGGGGEGIGQAPPPRPAATEPSGSNIPSPLKGEVAASKLRLSKALQLSGGEDPARELR